MDKVKDTPLSRLEYFYDMLIDRQFWFEANSETIRQISPIRHKIIYDIYFHPVILAQLSILDDIIPFRKNDLIKLLELFITLVEINYGNKVDLLAGLPRANPNPPRADRPRKRLPTGIPTPPIHFRHSDYDNKLPSHQFFET